MLCRDYKGRRADRLVTRIDPGVVALVAELRGHERKQSPSIPSRTSPWSNAPRGQRESQPLHSTTGSVGYFGKRGSMSDNLQRKNTEPRSERMVSTWAHVAHRPGPTSGATPQFDMAQRGPARGCSNLAK